MRLLSQSAEDTAAIAAILGKELVSGDTVLLYGDLGAGKSVFARGCAGGLGVHQTMASPSFTLMQPYRGDREEVYHFDLYRLSSPDELYFSGLEEHIGGEGVALIEWPQMGDVEGERGHFAGTERTGARDRPDAARHGRPGGSHIPGAEPV